MAFETGLAIGEVIPNSRLTEVFQCGNMGRMRRSKKTDTLVLVTNHNKCLYHDKWEGEVLHFTGVGKVGDQTLHGKQNITLHESGSNGVRVFLFEVFEPKHYTFQGEVKLCGEPYQDRQEDSNGDMRFVWRFPVQPIKY